MKITNKLELPEAFVKMANYEEKINENEIRVTTLLNGLCEAELKRRHHDEIEQDVSDMIWLLFGTAVHGILEKYEDNGADVLTEERLRMHFGDMTLTGKCDHFNKKTGIITDYKTCSVWKVIYGDYTDWKKQLMLYGVLLRNAGYEVKGGRIIALMKDHNKTKSKTDAGYPELPVKVIEFTFTDEDLNNAQEFAENRISSLKAIRNMEVLLPCTAEERYNTGDKFAVMKKGRKRALKVCETINEAEENLKILDGDCVEIRKGEDKKCNEYCSVKDFCPYMKRKGDEKKCAE